MQIFFPNIITSSFVFTNLKKFKVKKLLYKICIYYHNARCVERGFCQGPPLSQPPRC